MMGERTVMQESLFYGFSLEDHVPADHLLRSIDRFVDCSAANSICYLAAALTKSSLPSGRLRMTSRRTFATHLIELQNTF